MSEFQTRYYERTRELTSSLRLLLLVGSGGVTVPADKFREMLELMEVMAKVTDVAAHVRDQRKSWAWNLRQIGYYLGLIALGAFYAKFFDG